jgi:UDP-2,3-diacylglucosamine hydrolase
MVIAPKSTGSLSLSPSLNVEWSAAIVTRLGLIAGNGVFPLQVARAARRDGVEVVAVAHQGETDPMLAELVGSITWIKVGELQRMVDAFKAGGVTTAAMAGGIARASLPAAFAPDPRALAMLQRIGRFSDDAVLRGVADELEAEGIAIIDPVPMLDDVIAQAGVASGPEPSAGQLKDLALAFMVARTVGRFDIGQTVAVRDGVVAAVEAVEGTDAALRRAAKLCGPGLVVAKAAKPGQDLRFDRPAIGPATIELLAEIGGAMIGIEAGTAMLLEREVILERAQTRSVTVYGYG